MLISMPLKKTFRFLTLLGLALAGTTQPLSAQTPAAEIPPAQPRRPSIVFILADDLGYGDLGCYGQQRIKTPNIDRLAAGGMLFTSCYAGSTVCAPSRAALMTGLHTGHLGIRGNADLGLDGREQSLGKLLKSAGYFTGAIGKWGLGEANTPGAPAAQGFDEFFGYLNQTQAHNYYPDRLFRSTPEGKSIELEVWQNRGGARGKYSHDYFTEAALNFIRINAPDAANQYKPFFLYLSYTIPHANNELGQQTGNGMEVPSDAPYSGELWPAPERNKAAMITRLDTDVGKLLAKLDELKIAKNTIVIFASDNGPHKEGGVNPAFFRSAGALRGIKRDLYEGGIRVPLIVRWPFYIQAAATNDLPVAFWDFLPTFADVARVAPPQNTDGISFLPTLYTGGQTNRHEFLYWEFHEGGFSQSVRMGRWKGVRHGSDGPLELYDLQTDPAERLEVSAQHPAEAARIVEYLKTARKDDPKWPAKTLAQNEESKPAAKKDPAVPAQK